MVVIIASGKLHHGFFHRHQRNIFAHLFARKQGCRNVNYRNIYVIMFDIFIDIDKGADVPRECIWRMPNLARPSSFVLLRPTLYIRPSVRPNQQFQARVVVAQKDPLKLFGHLYLNYSVKCP